MNLAFREHERVARLIAKELEDEGYAVFLEPTPEQMPFSLEGYNPDLLATKADDNLIIEIKSKKSPELMARYRKVIDIIQEHPGWKFLVKTFSDASQGDEISAPSSRDIKAIEEYLLKAEKVASLGTSELAVPFLWNAIVALLRRKSHTAEPGVYELTDRSLVNQLYSLGDVSAEQYDMLRKWQELRNLAVQNLDFVADSKDVDTMLAFAKMLISEIRH